MYLNRKINLFRVKKLIRSSIRPILLIGSGARDKESINLIYKLKSQMNIPILLSHNSLDILSYDDENNLGFPGIFGNRFSNLIVQSSDLIISIGSRLGFAQTGYNKQDFGRNAKKIIVDIDKYELVKHHINCDVKLNITSKEFLNYLNENVGEFKRLDSKWIKRCNEIKARHNSQSEPHEISDSFVNSYNFIDILSQSSPQNTNYCTDMGLSYQSTYQGIKLKLGDRLITNTNLASMGWGISASVGICIGSNYGITVLLTGDGGIMMNLQELGVIMKHNLPIKIFIYNNGGYLTMKQSQELAFAGYNFGVDNNSGVAFPNWKFIAQAFNLRYVKIENNAEIKSKLMDVFSDHNPTIVDIKMSIDQPQIPRAITVKKDSHGFSQSKIENPYPFMDENKLQSTLRYLCGF
jgi:acetolactate synthase-1/2/3 large subunit